MPFRSYDFTGPALNPNFKFGFNAHSANEMRLDKMHKTPLFHHVYGPDVKGSSYPERRPNFEKKKKKIGKIRGRKAKIRAWKCGQYVLEATLATDQVF